MFNRANEGFRKTLKRSTSTPEGRPDLGQFEAHLGTGEDVLHVLRTDSGIEHETNERTTTIEPGGDTAAYAVVTNRQVMALLGDTPEVSFDLAAVEDVALREHLLSSTFEVRTDAETLRMGPADGEEAAAAATTIEVVGAAWSDLDDALESVRSTIDEVEAAIDAGEDPSGALTRARSRLSKAHHCATRDDALPTERMREEINPVETELDRLRVRGRVQHVEERIDDIEAAREDDRYREAYDSFLEATETMTALESVVAELPTLHGSIAERVADVSTRTRNFGEALLGDALAACERADHVDDPGDAVAAWTEPRDRYAAALAAGWDGQLDVSATALRYQLSWVVGRQIDALVDLARAEEHAGDTGDGEDTERYEAAEIALERAVATAEDHPHADADRFEEPLDRVRGKIERSEWQWGGADE